MRRKGSDQVGRWPWGVWLALVGVSAGTVASFAAVGWAFMHAAGLVEESGAAHPLAWDRDGVVIEAERTTEGGQEAEDAEPTAGALSAPEPEAATVTAEEERQPSAEPRPERPAEASPQLMPTEPPPSKAEEPALVPLDPFLSHAPTEAHTSSNAGSPSASPREQLIMK